jgi:hypothetical protein
MFLAHYSDLLQTIGLIVLAAPGGETQQLPVLIGKLPVPSLVTKGNPNVKDLV